MAAHSSILAWKIPWKKSLQATVHGVAKSPTQLSDHVHARAHTHTHTHTHTHLCGKQLNSLSLVNPLDNLS